MKKFIVYSDVIKIFNEEKDLIKYLGTENSKKVYSSGKYISKTELITVQTVEVEVLEENNAANYLEAYIEETKRETRLNGILGDEFCQKIENFKSLFLKFSKDDKNKTKFISQLESIPVDKKSYSKLFTMWTGYLFSVNESVEWYKSILDIHNYRKIEDSYVREIYYSNGTSRYVNVKTNEEAKENFLKAKSIK